MGDAAEKDAQFEALNANVEGKAAQIETLNADLEAKSQAIDTLMSDAAEKDARIEAQNAAIDEKDAQINALSADNLSKDASIESFSAKISEMTASAEVTAQQAAAQAEEIQALQAELADKESELQSANEKLAALESKDILQHVESDLGWSTKAPVSFTDLTEDSPYTAAVSFMMEHGLMVPKAENAFGAADDATAGDFAVPLSIINDGPSDPDGAVKFLIEAGLFTSDTVAADTLTRQELILICNALTDGTTEIQLPESDAENATRGDVALLYYQLMN